VALIAGGASRLAAADSPLPLPSKSDKWVEIRTRNFTLYGDASESKIREVGLEMERLRAVLVALKRGSSTNAPVPTYVYVFKNAQILETYLPYDEGEERHRWASLFQGGPDGNYAMFSAAWNEDPRPSVYHSYIYDFIDANFEGLPLWYEVGIAGYYSTFQTEGDEARTGKPSDEYLQRLRTRGMWQGLDRLLAAKRESPEYSDPDKTSVFFAESWALVHYLMQGNPSRTPQLGKYLTLVGQGEAQDQAFKDAFGTDYATLYGELNGYVRNNKRFTYNRFQFAELKPPSEATTKPMSYEDVVVRLGDLFAHTRRYGEAERFYETVRAASPEDPGALAGLAWVRWRQEKKDEAAALFRRAAAAGSTDFRVYYYEGRDRWEAIGGSYDPNDAEKKALLEAARAAFHRSIELNPDFADGLAAYGRTYRLEPRGAGVDEGIAALEEARKRLPTRDDIALDLAVLYERKGDGARAASLRKAAGGTTAASTSSTSSVASSQWDQSSSRFQARVEEINRLLEAHRVDEAIAVLDGLIAESSGEMRTEMESQRAQLVNVAARNKEIQARNEAVDLYNSGIALYNKREYGGALAAFEKVARNSPDPELTKAAKAKVTELKSLLSKKKPGKP
jgi:tetratricopeptide (TPR) repeat protein